MIGYHVCGVVPDLPADTVAISPGVGYRADVDGRKMIYAIVRRPHL